MLHRIDRFILKELLTHDYLHFSELRPPSVESNTLTYRLKRFIDLDYVGKNRIGQYFLTAKGRLYTDRLNLREFAPRELPKPLILIICRRKNGDWLLYERFIHPFKDKVGFPHANVNSGISIIEATEKRFIEVMGLRAKFIYRGGGFLTYYKDKALEGYNQFVVVENITEPKGQLRENPELGMGRYFWQPKPNFNDSIYIPSLKDIEHQLTTKQSNFFVELTYKI